MLKRLEALNNEDYWGQFNKESTLVIFTRVIYTCKVQLVNTRI